MPFDHMCHGQHMHGKPSNGEINFYEWIDDHPPICSSMYGKKQFVSLGS